MSGFKAKWSYIVNSVNKHHNPIIQGLKVTLFLKLNRTRPVSFIIGVKSLGKVALLMVGRNKIRVEQAEKGKTIVLIPHGSLANVNNLIPVIQNLNGNDLSLMIIAKTVKSKDLPASYKNILKIEDALLSIPHLKRIKALWRSLNDLHELFYLIKQDGYICEDKSLGLSLYLLYQILIINLSTIVSDKIIHILKPKLVITTSEYFPFEYAFIRKALSYNSKVFMIQHGIIGLTNIPSISSKIIVWGDYFKDELTKLGANPEDIVPLGMPAMDKLVHFNAKKSESNHFDNKILVLSDTHAYNLWPELYNEYKNLIREFLQNNPSVEFCVRLHPAENSSFYDDLITKYSNIKIQSKNNSLIDDLNSCSLVITIWSTAGLEAMICEKPLIVLNINREVEDVAWWPKLGGGVYCNTQENFAEIINDLILQSNYSYEMVKKQNDFINRCFTNLGNAAQAIAKHIENELL